MTRLSGIRSSKTPRPAVKVSVASNHSIRRDPDCAGIFQVEEHVATEISIESDDDAIVKFVGDYIKKAISKPSEDVEKTRKFLESISSLSQDGKIDEAIDEVIDFFEEALQQDDINLCEAALNSAIVDVIDVADVLLGMLSMTVVEKERIHSRRHFYLRVRRHLRKSYDEVYTEELLKGLK